MSDQARGITPDELYRCIRLRWVALLLADVTIFTLGILIEYVVAEGRAFPGFWEGAAASDGFAKLRIALFALAFPLAAVAFAIRRSVKRYAPCPVVAREMPSPKAAEEKSLARTAAIIHLSLVTVGLSATFGLALYVAMGGLGWLALFCGVSFVWKLVLSPGTAEIDEALKHVREATRSGEDGGSPLTPAG